MIKEAIKAFEEVIGAEYTHTDSMSMEKYHSSCIPVSRVIAAVLQPDSAKDVQQIVKIAAKFNVGLYPISTGNNWGYGSANPVRDNNIIVDLSRMNRIIEVNQKLAYTVIEPGVTQQQLYEYLYKNKTGLIMDPTGSGPSCSVLANTLERGYGITPCGDHFASTCGMEIVLADGEILKTGFGHFENANATHLFKYGTGPYLDGIFTQSNLGIVTSIGLWLMPEPEYFEACYFSCENENGLGDLIDATRWLLLHRIVKGSINLMHKNRVLTLLTRYPWEEMSGKTPLDDKVGRAAAIKRNIGAWNGVVALYGTREEVKAAKKVVKRVLRAKVSKINFISDKMLNLIERYLIERFQWALKPLGHIMKIDILEMFKILSPSYRLLKGKPCEVSLPTPYWRMKTDIPSQNINPAKDNCGIIWFAPVVPMTRENAKEFINILNPILAEYGFESCITFTTVTHRSFDCTIPILYNKNDPVETEQAVRCHAKVEEECMRKGYVPYRFGIQSMAGLVGKKDVFWDVVGKIKKALDPAEILSPGRYSR